MKLPISLALAAFAASITLAPIASALDNNPDTHKCGDEKDEKKDEDKS
jgi:hypothetical protein